jgi:hypothetical protein
MLTFGRRLTPAELFMRIDAVDVDSIHECGRRLIEDKVRGGGVCLCGGGSGRGAGIAVVATRRWSDVTAVSVQPLAVAAFGDIGELPDYTWMMRRTSSHRRTHLDNTV